MLAIFRAFLACVQTNLLFLYAKKNQHIQMNMKTGEEFQFQATYEEHYQQLKYY